MSWRRYYKVLLPRHFPSLKAPLFFRLHYSVFSSPPITCVVQVEKGGFNAATEAKTEGGAPEPPLMKKVFFEFIAMLLFVYVGAGSACAHNSGAFSGSNYDSASFVGMVALACLVAVVLERAPLGRFGSDRAALS